MAIREDPDPVVGPSAPGASEGRADRHTPLDERLSELEAQNARLRAALAEKIHAEQAQAAADAHFRAGFESDAVGQAHYDPVTGATIRVNRAHARMLGYEPEELIGRPGREFTWPEDRGAEPYRRMIAGELETYSREKRYIRKDGTPVWGRVSASLVRAPGTGEPLLAVAVIEDIDDRYKAQLALAEAKRELEAVVEERTAALAQRDLLLREVYHRVKNNLQVVDSLILMQTRRLDDPDAKAALNSLRARVYALGLVHHQLMGSSDLETFEIAPFLQDLSEHLVGDAGPGAAIVRAAPLKVGLDFAIPLGLLVTELVTGPAGRPGPVEVALEPGADGRLVLRVTGAEVARRVADPAGDTLSDVIIERLVQQMKGVLTIDREGVVVSLPASA